MASYTVYEKPGLSAEEAITSAILVKNHYSMLAFFFPFVWLLIQRLWWILLAYLIVMAPVVALESVLPPWSGMVLTLLIGWWFSIEAPTLIGWSLERKGYVEVATFFAEDTDHCDRRYVEARIARAPVSGAMAQQVTKGAVPATTPNQTLRDRAPKGSVIGLFPAPNTSQENK